MKLISDAIKVIILEITATNLIFIDATFFVASADIERIFGHHVIFCFDESVSFYIQSSNLKTVACWVGRVISLIFSGNNWRFCMCSIDSWENGGKPKVQ